MSRASSEPGRLAFRKANDEIRVFAGRIRADGSEEAALPVPFLCECADVSCTHVVRLTLSDYDRVHGREDRFAVLPGHEQRDGLELVVERRAEWVVVEPSPVAGARR